MWMHQIKVLKILFAFERQMDNVLGSKTFKKLKCSLIDISLDETILFFNPILFVLPLKFVKYITNCTKSITKQMTFGINKPIKEGLALKV